MFLFYSTSFGTLCQYLSMPQKAGLYIEFSCSGSIKETLLSSNCSMQEVDLVFGNEMLKIRNGSAEYKRSRY